MNNQCVSDMIDSRTFEEVFKEMNFETPITYNLLDQYYSTEGIVWDAAKGIKNTVKTVRKAGKTAYKAAKTQGRKIKDKWNKIKPIIIKAIKDLGITLSNMYGRFMKYDKDYKDLAAKIDNVINVKVPLLGKVETDILVDIYDININTLSNVCKMVESYEGFVSIVVNDMLNKTFIQPPDFIKLVERNTNMSTGEVRLNEIRSAIDPMVRAIGDLNAKGELTIPNKIWTDRKWYVPVNIPFMKKRNEKREWQKDMDNTTAAGFTKLSITGQLEEITISGDEVDKFKDLLVKSNKTGYLNVMKDFLNNRIIEQTLKKSGSSLKKETKAFFSNLDKTSSYLDGLMKKINEAKIRSGSNDEDQSPLNQNNSSKPETVNKASTGGENEVPGRLTKVNKTLAGSYDGSIATADDSIESVVDTYLDSLTSFFMNTSSVYGSMVNGLTAASFEIIVNCKHIVDKINSITNFNNSNTKKVNK